MTKHLALLLFIGFAWGQIESDTTQIDYSKMGIDAANNDFNSRSYYYAGCTGYGVY